MSGDDAVPVWQSSEVMWAVQTVENTKEDLWRTVGITTSTFWDHVTSLVT